MKKNVLFGMFGCWLVSPPKSDSAFSISEQSSASSSVSKFSPTVACHFSERSSDVNFLSNFYDGSDLNRKQATAPSDISTVPSVAPSDISSAPSVAPSIVPAGMPSVVSGVIQEGGTITLTHEEMQKIHKDAYMAGVFRVCLDIVKNHDKMLFDKYPNYREFKKQQHAASNGGEKA